MKQPVTTTAFLESVALRRRSKRFGAVALVIGLTFGVVSLGASQTPGYIVIANPDTSAYASESDRRFLMEAFLKKISAWPNGKKIRPIDLPRDSAVRERFSNEVLGRSVSAVGHYWSQIIFSGRGVPPPELDSDAAVVRFVLQHPGAIGYVSERADVHGATVLHVR